MHVIKIFFIIVLKVYNCQKRVNIKNIDFFKLLNLLFVKFSEIMAVNHKVC